jgi:hypothetical protein
MDRSYLSQPDVITASRQFVCVRLTTYEDKEEGDFLKAFRVTRSGELENTVFTILAPDGKKQLARAARSARQTFVDAPAMAETMTRISREHPGKDPADGKLPELPIVRNLRLAIDVAACDNRPLVVLCGTDLEERLNALAWSGRFMGRFIYVKVADAKELAGVDGAKPEPGVLVLESDRFGQKAKTLRQVGAMATEAELVSCLEQAAGLYQGAEKTFAGHVQQGHRLGVFWETVIPVTDPMERQARERGRR